jgi:hypothetical protein
VGGGTRLLLSFALKCRMLCIGHAAANLRMGSPAGHTGRAMTHAAGKINNLSLMGRSNKQVCTAGTCPGMG